MHLVHGLFVLLNGVLLKCVLAVNHISDSAVVISFRVNMVQVSHGLVLRESCRLVVLVRWENLSESISHLQLAIVCS